jgi:uridine kinase
MFEHWLELGNCVKQEQGEKILVISMAGAGCIGKTTLAMRFREFVGDSRCQIVGLDGYMLGRERAAGISGYDPRRFELARARAELSELIYSGQDFVLYQYNRQTHQRDIPEHVKPKEIILIEGGLALGEELYDLADVRIFLDSDQETQYQLRLRREQREFNYSPRQVRDRFEQYYRDYLAFIYPRLQYADIVYRVDGNYNQVLVRDSTAMQ